MVRARIHPEGLITMFQTLQEEGSGSSAPQFLVSHPATKERIENVRDQIAQQSLTDDLRHDDLGRLPIIRERIRLLIGTDTDVALESLEDSPDVPVEPFRSDARATRDR